MQPLSNWLGESKTRAGSDSQEEHARKWDTMKSISRAEPRAPLPKYTTTLQAHTRVNWTRGRETEGKQPIFGGTECYIQILSGGLPCKGQGLSELV